MAAITHFGSSSIASNVSSLDRGSEFDHDGDSTTGVFTQPKLFLVPSPSKQVPATNLAPELPPELPELPIPHALLKQAATSILNHIAKGADHLSKGATHLAKGADRLSSKARSSASSLTPSSLPSPLAGRGQTGRSSPSFQRGPSSAATELARSLVGTAPPTQQGFSKNDLFLPGPQIATEVSIRRFYPGYRPPSLESPKLALVKGRASSFKKDSALPLLALPLMIQA